MTTKQTVSISTGRPQVGATGLPDSGWKDPSTVPLAERRMAMQRATATYSTNVSKYTRVGGPITAAATYDPITPAQCQSSWDAGADPSDLYWKKNHFAACALVLALVENYRCQGTTCTKIGAQALEGEFILATQRGPRTITYDVSLRASSSPTLTWGVNDPTTPVSIPTVCSSSLTGDACTTTSPKMTAPLSAWIVGKSFRQVYTDTGTVGDPIFPAAESRSYFQSYIGISNERYSNYNTRYLRGVGVRCDTASYASNGGCIFDSLVGNLHFSLSDPTVTQAAQHIRDAQTNVSLTKPGYSGTVIPGSPTSGRALTRNYYNTTLVNQSRTKVRATCQQYWGTNYTVGPNGETMECDEYPFAKTYQNAATTTPTTLLSYSARPVIATQNGAAGRVYGQWLTDDHILDSDPFWVTVGP